MSKPLSPYLERRNFQTSRHVRMLVDLKEMTADDWRRVKDAHDAFLFQVRGIVWDAQHRDPKPLSDEWPGLAER